MWTVADLQAAVEAGYSSLQLSSWADPHPGRTPPVEGEYSCLTCPERYRIVQARGRVWRRALRTMPGVQAEPLAPAPLDADGRLGTFDRGTRLTSRRPGSLALLLLERDAPVREGGGVLPVLQVSVVRPEIPVLTVPDCGCDACDSGSQDLLDAIDDAILRIVGGTSVVLCGRGWQAQWWPAGGSSHAGRRAPGHDQLMQWCRRLASGQHVRLPRGTEAYIGRTWLDER
jgi:hypothetical protein